MPTIFFSAPVDQLQLQRTAVQELHERIPGLQIHRLDQMDPLDELRLDFYLDSVIKAQEVVEEIHEILDEFDIRGAFAYYE